MSLLSEGGPVFMYPLLALLIIELVLSAKGLAKTAGREKTLKLLSSISLFALVFGFLGQVIGLIGAFDAIESIEKINSSIFAAGLKMSFLTTAFGALVFLIGRLGIILITLTQKA